MREPGFDVRGCNPPSPEVDAKASKTSCQAPDGHTCFYTTRLESPIPKDSSTTKRSRSRSKEVEYKIPKKS